MLTPGQRDRTARTKTRSTRMRPRLVCALPGRSSAVIRCWVSPSKRSRGWIQVLAVVAVVSRPLLLAVRGVVGAVDVQQDVRRWTILLSLLQVHRQQRVRQVAAGPAVHRVLQAREGGLAGQLR